MAGLTLPALMLGLTLGLMAALPVLAKPASGGLPTAEEGANGASTA